MNLATLLGKIANARSSVEPLRKLAESDDDWRVRVNAFKALSSFRLQREDAVLTSFRRAFTDANMSVALTALTALGTARIVLNDSSAALTDLRTVLERIAWNEGDAYLWQLQAEAGAALAALEGKPAFPKLRLGDGPNRILRGRVLGAMGLTGNPDALPVLVPYAQGNDALLFRSALEGMQELSRRNRGNSSVVGETYASAIKALQVNDVALVTTAASVLGDSLFLRPSSVDPLIDRLGQLRIPDDIEAIQEIVATLGTLKNPRAEGVLESTMKRPDRSVALAAAAALRAITGRDPSPGFPSSFEPLYTDFDYAYLNGLPETVHVALETIRGNIVLELYRNVAPFTVMSLLKQATQRGFFRGIPFHRVVPNFVVQGGDPRGDGWGGPGYSIRSEFSWLRYDRGTVGMASAGKDTEGSQFFITHSPQPHLDGRYTIIGNVVSGMDIVDRLQIDDHILDLKILP
jgi:peptidylprolyl isomerase